jgi:uncharacterized membrane protein YdjX (TVP38/TMEM64 family)
MGRDHRASLLGLAVLAVAVLVAAVLLPTLDLDTIRAGVRGSGALSWATFLVLMVGATQLPVPRTIWTVAAGVLFGPVVGSVLALAGMAVSVTLSLVLVRWIGGAAVRRAEQAPRFRALQAALEGRGWVAVLGLRMIPVIPFSLLNYACGLSRVPLLPCVLATVAGSAPLTVAVVASSDVVVNGGEPWFLGVSVALAAAGALLTVTEWRRIRTRMAAEPGTVKPSP